MSNTVQSDNSLFVNLPNAVANAILQDASRRLELLISKLRIIQVEEQPLSDGCLGLTCPSEFCTRALVPGYEVTLEGEQKLLVYRTMHLVPMSDCLLF
jgi:hypothetical protein